MHLNHEAASEQSSYRSVPFAELDPVIEDYLDTICAPLVGAVPYAERIEIRTKLRANVEELTLAYVELGCTRSEAVNEAIAKLKEAPGEQTLKEEPSHALTLESRRVTRRVFILAMAISYLTIMVSGSEVYQVVGERVLAFVMLWLPLLAGFWAGNCAPVKAVQSTLRSARDLAIPALCMYQVWAHAAIRFDPMGDGLKFGFAHIFGWAFFGAIGAWFGSMARLGNEPTAKRSPFRRTWDRWMKFIFG